MSHSSIDRAANDGQLQERVKAATYKILYTDDECRSSIFGQTLLNSGGFGGSSQLTSMYWAVAVATESEYEAAVAAGNGSPGFDETVITDAVISDVVESTWPRDQPSTPTLPVVPPS